MDGSYGCYIGSPRKIGKVDTSGTLLLQMYLQEHSQNFPEDRPSSRTDSAHEKLPSTVPLKQTGYIINVTHSTASISKDVWPSG